MERLPTLFVSHGAPTFALSPGLAGPMLAEVGRRLPRPQAVLVVSPHWMTREPHVAVTPQPRTIAHALMSAARTPSVRSLGSGA